MSVLLDFICSDITLQELYDYVSAWSGWTSKTSISTKLKIDRIGYQVVPFPSPFSDRVLVIEEHIQLLSNENIIIAANKTTTKSVNFAPNDVKKGRILMRMDCGGVIHEMIDDTTSKITYTFCGNLGGFVPQNISNILASKEMKRFQKKFLKDFSKKKTYSPMYYNFMNDIDESSNSRKGSHGLITTSRHTRINNNSSKSRKESHGLTLPRKTQKKGSNRIYPNT